MMLYFRSFFRNQAFTTGRTDTTAAQTAFYIFDTGNNIIFKSNCKIKQISIHIVKSPIHYS